MHFASYYRWLVYQHLFGTPPAIATLLDIGSDDGGFVERINPHTAVTLDIDRQRLLHAPTEHTVCADGTQMPFADTTFDMVILSDVIEHVENDEALVHNATSCVKTGGTFWLSTTAEHFLLFPPAITARAERSWGHVRKGYTPQRLQDAIGDAFHCTAVEWPEFTFRHLYAVLWVVSKYWPGAARVGAALCFALDSRLRTWQPERGHIYIQAVRRQSYET